MPPPGDRRPPGQEAPGRLPADRQVRLHRLPHDRRRGLVRPRPDRRAARSARTSRTSPPRSPRTGSLKWIKNPHAFRPDTRMPRFYGLTNNDAPEDQPKNHAEIHAITHYLFAKSTPAGRLRRPARQDRRRAGQGALPPEGLHGLPPAPALRAGRGPAGRPRRRSTRTTSPTRPRPTTRGLPRVGPRLRQGRLRPEPLEHRRQVPVAADKGFKWLANWIQAPEKYHPKSLMPNLQLSLAGRGRHRRAGSSRSPASGRSRSRCRRVDVERGQGRARRAGQALRHQGGIQEADGKTVAVPLSEVDDVRRASSRTDEKLMFLGEKTISRLGCFGCHNIPGFENAKPIGTPLNGWGSKSPTQARLRPHRRVPRRPASRTTRATATAPTCTTRRSSSEHTRIGLPLPEAPPPAELRLPEDERGLKTWDDRLRMPQFAWANDPAAVEEVMTFVLGLTGEKIAASTCPRRTTRRPDRAGPGGQGPEPVQLHGLPRPGDAQVHDRRRDEARPRRSPTSRRTSASSYNSRANDYLAELYPGLTLRPEEEARRREHRGRAGLEPDDGRRSPSRGCRSACSRTS